MFDNALQRESSHVKIPSEVCFNCIDDRVESLNDLDECEYFLSGLVESYVSVSPHSHSSCNSTLSTFDLSVPLSPVKNVNRSHDPLDILPSLQNVDDSSCVSLSSRGNTDSSIGTFWIDTEAIVLD